jgi:hypothetical protein
VARAALSNAVSRKDAERSTRGTTARSAASPCRRILTIRARNFEQPLLLHATSRTLHLHEEQIAMIRKLKSGEYRLYSRKKNPKTGKRRNLGTFKSRAAAEKHEKAVQFFKRA